MKKHTLALLAHLLILLFLPYFSFSQAGWGCLDIPSPGITQCNDNGTPGDPSDDTWTVEITVVDPLDIGTSWVSSDPNMTAGSYGVPTILGPFPASIDVIFFFVGDVSLPDVATFMQVVNNPCAPPPCGMSVPLGPYGCSWNATESDPTDDVFSYQLTINGAGPGTGWTANDPNNTIGNYGNQTYFGDYPTTGGPLLVTITDNVDPACNMTIFLSSMNCLHCVIINGGFAGITCVDAGIPNDPSDDVWEFILDPLAFGDLGSNYVVTVSNGTLGSDTGLYGGPTPFTWTNTDNTTSFVVTITDVNDPCCFTTFVVTLPPGGCLNNCSITATPGNIQCDDNGTPSDPSDDTFTFNVLVNGTGTGTFWTATDPNGTSGSYGINQLFGPYPISGGALFFSISDSADPSCMDALMVSPPPPCSNEPPCNLLDVGLGLVTCDDAGTPFFPDDDILVIEISPTGVGLGTSYLVTSPLLTIVNGSGVYGNLSTQQLIAAGSIPPGTLIPITITDVNDPSCSITIDIPNSTPCIACDMLVTLGTYNCNDNGTPNDPLDDTYTVSAVVSATGTSWSANDPNNTTGAYDVVVTFGPYLIINGIISFEVTDATNPNCFASVTLIPPDPCSVPAPCIMVSSSQSILCDDNGTPTDPSDDTFTFDILVNGVNTGTGWTDGTVNGNYGIALNYGPFPI